MSNHKGRYAAPRKPRNPFYLLAALAVGALLLVGACSETGSTTSAAGQIPDDQTELEAVRAECAPGSNHITVGDDGSTLLLDHKGEDETAGASLDSIVCVLAELDVPDSVIAQMDSTSAMDGRQSASWDGYEASWGYHPDSGIDLILTES